MITVFGGFKGGPGKSTAVENAAVELARKGHSVIIVDADKQRTVAKWAARRVESGHAPEIPLVEKRGAVHSTLQELDKHYDHVLVDVAGDDNQEQRTAMTAAHQLIIVLRPSQADVETLEEFSEVVDAVHDFNPGLTVRSILNQAPTTHNETETQDVSEFIIEFEQIKPLETVLYYRKAYRDALPDGRSVVELNNPKARAEVQEFVSEVWG